MLLLLLALLACRSSTNGPGDDSGASCEAPTVTAGFPAEGQDPVSRAASIALQVEGSAGLTQLRVSVAGEALAGSLTEEAGVLRWTPDALMPAEAVVEWTAQACGSDLLAGSFVTGAHGELVDPASLVDQAWGMDLTQATWEEPVGGEALFGQLFAGLLALGVQDQVGDSLDIIGGAAEEVDTDLIQQDPCIATFELPGVSFQNNPYIDAGPTVLSLDFQGIEVPVQQVHISGAFIDQGQALADARLEAEVDARDMADSLGGTASELCDLLESYVGLSCVACSSDGEERCIALKVKDIDGELIPGLSLQPNPDPQECDGETTGLR